MDLRSHCHRCGVTLTDEEKYFYEITCEDCERKWFYRIEAWRRGGEDKEFDNSSGKRNTDGVEMLIAHELIRYKVSVKGAEQNRSGEWVRFIDAAGTITSLQVEIESLSAQVAELTKEIERLRLPPEETLSAHPGCVFCMEAGTPVRPGQVCPKCGDRLPTREEYALRAQVVELKKDAERYHATRKKDFEDHYPGDNHEYLRQKYYQSYDDLADALKDIGRRDEQT